MSDGVNDLMVVPGAQMRAILSLILAERVQKPPEVILNDDADEYARVKAKMDFYGTPKHGWIYHNVLDIIAAGGLRKAIKTMDPYLQLQMLESTPEKVEAAKIEADREVAATKVTEHDTGHDVNAGETYARGTGEEAHGDTATQ